MSKAKVVSIKAKEPKKKIAVAYLPVFDTLTPAGKVIKKQLNPRDSFDKAEGALKEALINEPIGSNGQIEKFYVCVEDESKPETPPEKKLILPD
jgi:hypothetical protein